MRNRFETPVIVLRHRHLRLLALLLAGPALMPADDLCELSSGTLDGFLLRKCRPAPVLREDRAAVLASLPPKGEVTVLNESERRKIAAIRRMLDFHDRTEAYLIKV